MRKQLCFVKSLQTLPYNVNSVTRVLNEINEISFEAPTKSRMAVSLYSYQNHKMKGQHGSRF